MIHGSSDMKLYFQMEFMRQRFQDTVRTVFVAVGKKTRAFQMDTRVLGKAKSRNDIPRSEMTKITMKMGKSEEKKWRRSHNLDNKTDKWKS